MEFYVAAYRSATACRPLTRCGIHRYPDRATVAVLRVPLLEAKPTDDASTDTADSARLKMQWSKFFVAAEAPTARPVRQSDASLSNRFRTPRRRCPSTPIRRPFGTLRAMRLPSEPPCSTDRRARLGRADTITASSTCSHVGDVVEVLRVRRRDQDLKTLSEDPDGTARLLLTYILRGKNESARAQGGRRRRSWGGARRPDAQRDPRTLSERPVEADATRGAGRRTVHDGRPLSVQGFGPMKNA